ncbi:MAG: Glu-tRNA(Gln) amidotransferase subunit GatD [Nitrosarchaeum sp.]|nr:Glu-tRNA(Gln) amidotransferase subunit GatD [Nitrosarchaeum sp.]
MHLLHTGGTIACRVDYATGAVVASFRPEEILALVPELSGLVRLHTQEVCNTQSEFMRFSTYNAMAKGVLQAVEAGARGVIITHGTDTMHYSAAALAFMLENLPVPVVLVGSQRSADRGSSDNYVNLLGAVRFVMRGLPGVFVAMHASSSDDEVCVHLGVRARKMHTSRRDAFRSINAAPFGVVDVKSGEVRAPALPAVKGACRVLPFREDMRVGLVMTHPQMFASELRAYEGFDGLVLAGTGLGHAPIEGCAEHEDLFGVLASLARKMPVVMASQCLYGRVNLDVYSPGRRIRDAGVLGHGLDMTPECAFVKLAWLLSTFPERVRELFQEDLRGEISARSQQDGFPEEK